MKTLAEASIEAQIDPMDITTLIANGRLRRPSRIKGEWLFSRESLDELISIPKDVLPSHQKRLRKRSFWSQQIAGVIITPSVISLTQAACEDINMLEANKQYIVQNHAVEFVKYAKSVDPSWLDDVGKVVFREIFAECEGYVELAEAMNLIEERKLISTHQLAIAVGVNDARIRRLWKERRVAPETISNSNAMLWRVDSKMVEDIKQHFAGELEMPMQKFVARRDIVHFAVSE